MNEDIIIPEDQIQYDIPPAQEVVTEPEENVLSQEVVPEPVEQPKEEPAAYKTFATQEEFDKFIEEERAKLLPNREEMTPEQQKIFDDNFKPDNWNDFAVKLLEKITPAVKEKIEQTTKAEREALERMDKELDRQYEEIAKKGLIPSLETPEGKEVNKQITMIGAAYGQPSITKAYELWSKIPKSQGGGLDYTTPSKANANKAASAKIGSSAGTASFSNGKQKTYEDIRKKSLDDLIDEELRS